MKYITIFLICGLLTGAGFSKDNSGIDMVLLSFLTWGKTNSSLGGGTAKDSYFYSLKADMYYHIGKTKGYVGAPLTLTLEYPKGSDDIRYSLFPIDLTLYFGRSFGPVEPRIGMDIPFGYPTIDEGAHAWTGSRNYNLLLGLGFSGGQYFNKRLSIGGEIMGRIFLNGLEQSAVIEKGSSTIYLAAKAAVKITDRLNSGVELFTEYKNFKNTSWTQYLADPKFTSYSILPILFAGYQPTPKTEIVLKGGLGREMGTDDLGTEKSTIIFINFGLNMYLW